MSYICLAEIQAKKFCLQVPIILSPFKEQHSNTSGFCARMREKPTRRQAPLFNLLIIAGATASGKTHLGVQLAQQLNGEILSGDSRQVYRGMDLGTGKDLHEYGDTPYHLIDLVEPGTEYSVFDYQKDFYQAFEDIQQRHTLPILVGGSSLYIDAVARDYQFVPVAQDPELRQQLDQLSLEQLRSKLLQLKPDQHNTTDLIERERLYRAIEIAIGEQKVKEEQKSIIKPKIEPLYIGIRWHRQELRKRIEQRLKQRLEQGMIDEVEQLLQQGVSHENLELKGLEYRFVSQHLRGQLNYNDMYQKLRSAINQFAKRQDTAFRRWERQGININWVEGNGDTLSQSLKIIERFSS